MAPLKTFMLCLQTEERGRGTPHLHKILKLQDILHASRRGKEMRQKPRARQSQGVNSIDIMNLGHETGHKTGPSSGPNSVLGHYVQV